MGTHSGTASHCRRCWRGGRTCGGLVPYWSKDLKVAFANINAKAEGIETKPVFREAFQRRRCLVPVDNFYEWAKIGTGKQPYAIALADRGLMALAGLWENWRSPTGEFMRTFAIINGPDLRQRGGGSDPRCRASRGHPQPYRHRGGIGVSAAVQLKRHRLWSIADDRRRRARDYPRCMLEGPRVMGESYTICDPYLFTLAEWLDGDGVVLANLPRVIDHRARMYERPAVKQRSRRSAADQRINRGQWD